MPGTSKDSESPYKNILHGINQVSLANDANDFASPKLPKKKSEPKKPVLAKNKKLKKGNRKKINPILKCFEDNSENMDVNPDHLQMALALSRSTFDQENPGEETESKSSILTTDKIPKVATFLEKYGFKCNKTQSNSKSRLEENKRKKNSKFRFVTPTLYTRSEEDRNSLIHFKVLAIIEGQNQLETLKEIDHSQSIKSPYLKPLLSNNKCWNMNNALFNNEFIVRTLNLEPSENTAGCLLKNWDDIQGRDKSPMRNVPNKEPTPQIVDDVKIEKKLKRICSSPDLFDDSSGDSLTEQPISVSNKLEIFPNIKNNQIEISPSNLQTHSNEPNVSTQSVDQPTCSVEMRKKPTKTDSINFDALLPKDPFQNAIDAKAKVSYEFESTYFKGMESAVSSPKQGIEQDSKGIEHYESFYEPSEKKDGFIDLTYSSDEDQSGETNGFDTKKYDQDQREETDQASNARPSLITKRSSLDSGNISLEYDRTKSLNVTDYVLEVLNSQDFEENENCSKSSNSQGSIEIVSDEELNYSSKFSESCVNANIYDLENENGCHGVDFCHDFNDKEVLNEYKKSPIKEIASDIENPKPLTSDQVCLTPVDTRKPSLNLNTPENMIVKTHNVTPMANYDTMDTPKIQEELDKFGIKPLKRRRGVDLLKYIYESTHPVVDINRATIDTPIKKRKLNPDFENPKPAGIKIVGATLTENENDDLLFERRFSKKIASCRIPLQIAWYNFLCCNPVLKENILLYEPIQLEVVGAMLNDQSGCKFHIEDLISFFDKKCITFRTNQWKNGKKRNPTKTQD